MQNSRKDAWEPEANKVQGLFFIKGDDKNSDFGEGSKYHDNKAHPLYLFVSLDRVFCADINVLDIK